MENLVNIIVSIIALEHFFFMVLEMYFWDKPMGLKIFKLSKEKAKLSKSLAANQGLYNGFLASGLIWGLILGTSGTNIKIFFLSCVFIAGIFGGITANKKILFIQALPAAIALLLVLII